MFRNTAKLVGSLSAATGSSSRAPVRLFSATVTPSGRLTRDEVKSRIYNVLGSFPSAKPISNLGLETDIVKHLGFDELYAIEASVAIEEEFDIEIPDNVAGELTTVEKTINYILGQTEAL